MDRSERKPLRVIQIGSWALLAVMTAGGWYWFGSLTAKSLLIGGMLANVSFWLLKRDLTRLLQGELTAVKTRFFIKYYSRLTLIAVLLFLIIRFGNVDVVGLLVGLSTVFISIALVAVYEVGKELKIEEAQ